MLCFVLSYALYANHVASELQTFVLLNGIRFAFSDGICPFDSLFDVALHDGCMALTTSRMYVTNHRAGVDDFRLF